MSSPEVSLREFLEAARASVDAELDRLLPPKSQAPSRLHEAMRYSVFAGGKRIRPILTLLSGELFGAPREQLLPGAAALEMIHTYSLIHDDLPALDNDDLRRGRPTLHRQFDEATAILAGDALLTHGLTVLAAAPTSLSPTRRRRAVELVGEAIGTAGMIGGQMGDLEAEKEWPADAAAALEWIHRRKTGALLAVAVRLGGVVAGVSPAAERRLLRLGEHLGLLFQISDDILDVVSSSEELGKTAGKDAKAAKLTYPGLFGLDESRRRLAAVAAEAHSEARALPNAGGRFGALIDFLGARRS